MATKIDDIVSKFPVKELPRIEGEPNYETINELVQILYGNAATLPTTLGGGANGHIGLIMKPTLYETLSDTPYAAPANPGPTAEVPANATAAAREQLRAEHADATKVFGNHNNMDEALKNQIIDAVDGAYINELRNRYTGFLGVHARDLIDHLMDRYGKITVGDLKANKERMEEPIDPSLPIDMYFKRIDDAVQYAADADTPYSAKQILQTAMHAMLSTGDYMEACTKWEEKEDDDKTWGNFKIFFAKEYHKLREQQRMTTKQGGFHSANSVISIETALDNLAMAATQDKGIVEELVKSNATLAEQLKTAVQTITELTKTIANSSTANEGGGEKKRYRYRPQSKMGKHWPDAACDKEGYCWTHGYKVTKGHTSRTCDAPAMGHQCGATRKNTMNGSTCNKDWVSKAE